MICNIPTLKSILLRSKTLSLFQLSGRSRLPKMSETQKRKAPQDDKSGPKKKRKVNKRRNMPFPLAGMRTSGPPNLTIDPPPDMSQKEDRQDGKPPNKRAKPTKEVKKKQAKNRGIFFSRLLDLFFFV